MVNDGWACLCVVGPHSAKIGFSQRVCVQRGKLGLSKHCVQCTVLKMKCIVLISEIPGKIIVIFIQIICKSYSSQSKQKKLFLQCFSSTEFLWTGVMAWQTRNHMLSWPRCIAEPRTLVVLHLEALGVPTHNSVTYESEERYCWKEQKRVDILQQ